MKTLKLVTMTLVLLTICSTAQAQLFKKLGDAAKRAAENAVTRQTERRTEDAVNKTIDGAFDKNNDSNSGNNNNDYQEPEQQSANTGNGNASATKQAPEKTVEMNYAKSDFVPGDEIIFDDQTENEQLGEFPSQWDLLRGTVEIAAFNGKKAIQLQVPTDAHIYPLMTEQHYLPDVFTIEFDFWVNGGGSTKDNDQSYQLFLYGPTATSYADHASVAKVDFGNIAYDGAYMDMNVYYLPPNVTDKRSVNAHITDEFILNDWNHFALSFNKRALKVYVNGVRIVNVPNMVAPTFLSIQNYTWGGFEGNMNAIKDFRIAKGAVPLYDRMMTDGKIITYGITFDIGKSTIKPESMVEINRIAQLMKDNPDLKFSVEGHTDSTGNATSNQTLSDARSTAVVDKLVELGIAIDRLKSSGKGQTSPIADNGTDEGRAKNRRVEFVKI